METLQIQALREYCAIYGLLMLLLISFPTAADVENLSIKYEPMTKTNLREFKEGIQKSRCAFVIRDFIDDRQNKQAVAELRSKSLQIRNIQEYLDILGDKANEFSNNEDAQHNIQVIARLIRLYSYPQAVNIVGVNATIFDFEVNGNILYSEQIRGFYGKANFANVDSEYLTTINYASNSLLQNYVNRQHEICDKLLSPRLQALAGSTDYVSSEK